MHTRESAFAAARPQLFAIAYRMLGSVMDAEDLLQEAYLRWQSAPDAQIRVPQAFLTTIVTRLAINQLRSAKRRREAYVGPWLPEPLLTDHAPDPSGAVELAESLSMALLVLLERLSPLERAVLLLREVFAFEYGEVARVVDRSEANCRQLLVRARKQVRVPRRRYAADAGRAGELVDRFTRAAEAGDLDGLLALLAEDVTLWADGGGKVRGAALRPIHGAAAVARFVAGVVRHVVPADRVLRTARINAQPGFLVYVAGRPAAAMVFEVGDDRIHGIYALGNPEKLRCLPPLA